MAPRDAMTRLRLLFFIVPGFVLSLATLSFPKPAGACQCIRVPPDAIFSGQVVAIEPIARGTEHHYFTWSGYQVTLAVDQVWKGQNHRQLMVQTNRAFDDACGYPFQVGQDYLVFASRYPPGTDGLVTTDCSGTKLAGEATEELALLGWARFSPLLLIYWFDPYAPGRLRDVLILAMTATSVAAGLTLSYRRLRGPAR